MPLESRPPGCWPVQAPSSLFPFKNEHYFDTSGSWNHQGFVHHKGDKESLRNTASKVAFWRVSRNPTNYCPKSMKFGYLFPWKTRGKRVSPRALLKSSKMMSKNHQSGDRRKTNFSTAIMIIIWTPLSLQIANESCTIKEAWKTSIWKKKKNWELAQVSARAASVAASHGRAISLPGVFGSFKSCFLLFWCQPFG